MCVIESALKDKEKGYTCPQWERVPDHDRSRSTSAVCLLDVTTSKARLVTIMYARAQTTKVISFDFPENSSGCFETSGEMLFSYILQIYVFLY